MTSLTKGRAKGFCDNITKTFVIKSVIMGSSKIA
jgi:hypothetical protein